MNIVTTKNPSIVAKYLAGQVIRNLTEGKKVLWLIPGGSAITAAVEAAKEISKHPHGHLTVTLTDERYGPIDHPDSNWFQLNQAGFPLTQSKLLPVLRGKDRKATTTEWNEELIGAFESAEYVLGFFGVGADGHIAGILPHTPPVDSDQYADSYESSQYERITSTPKAILGIDEAVAFAVGEAKWPALKKLNLNLPVDDHPAQLLKKAPEFILFTDMK